MQTEFSLAGWRTSRHSGSSANCVEVAAIGHIVGIRDSKQRGHGPVLAFTEATWRAFLGAVKGATLGA